MTLGRKWYIILTEYLHENITGMAVILLAKETVLKVYEAEQRADYAENDARTRAEKIVEDAKIKAAENSAAAVLSAHKESESRIEDARKNGDALILSIGKKAEEELCRLEAMAKAKRNDAIAAVINQIV